MAAGPGAGVTDPWRSRCPSPYAAARSSADIWLPGSASSGSGSPAKKHAVEYLCASMAGRLSPLPAEWQPWRRSQIPLRGRLRTSADAPPRLRWGLLPALLLAPPAALIQLRDHRRGFGKPRYNSTRLRTSCARSAGTRKVFSFPSHKPESWRWVCRRVPSAHRWLASL